MICSRCGKDGAIKNGSGRTYHAACGKYGVISPQDEPDPILAARRGWSPEHQMVHPTAPGFIAKGTSTLYREDGSVAAQWVKTTADQEAQLAALEAAVVAMGEKIPRDKPRPAPTRTVADLCNVYVLTDYHLGMLAWHEETGADWDTEIAEAMLVDWFAAAIAQAPAAESAVFAQLGDFLHWDGMDAVTPASKHLLDADTRFQKLVRVAIRAVRRVIGMLLIKHQRVHVLMAEGNHDPASSIWLREWLASSFELEPRVTVDTSPDPYYCVEHGKTALFFHHGHKRRPKDIDTVFAAKFREVFGRTEHAYAHMGHLHHIDVKETNLMVVEQHRTLAAPDAYASRGGWMSGRDAVVVTYSKRHGEVSRCRISSKMLEAA
ncbi:MAG: metallophosphoesterase [Pseudoxanthomonas sp.]|nr:metallophosphoesterase [Pseudoxanthomonas sp.]